MQALAVGRTIVRIGAGKRSLNLLQLGFLDAGNVPDKAPAFLADNDDSIPVMTNDDFVEKDWSLKFTVTVDRPSNVVIQIRRMITFLKFVAGGERRNVMTTSDYILIPF